MNFKLIIRMEPAHNYMGMVQSNEPLPGEDWRRGQDCADGAWSEETLERIIADLRALFASRGELRAGEEETLERLGIIRP